jgi:hypothetical protein
MPEAVKPATDNAAKPAVETDASKKEKAAADGALDKMKTEVADATKPGEAKKPEDAAKKPEDVAKKPEEAAKAPAAEKSWAELALDEVRNSSIASWMGIKAPDKSHAVPKVEEVAKAKAEAPGFLDLGAPIAGYEAKKTEAALELKKPTDAKAAEPAKDGGGILGWIGDAASSVASTAADAWKWTKENFYTGIAERTDKALDSFGEVKFDDSKYTYEKISKDDALYDILVKGDNGSETTVGNKGIKKTYGEIETSWDRETKSSRVVDKATNTSYERYADGTQMVTQADGTRIVKRNDGSYERIIGDTRTKIEGDAEKKIVSQKFGELELIHHDKEVFRLENMGRYKGNPNRVHTAGNDAVTTSPDGQTQFGSIGGKAFAITADQSTYTFDRRHNVAIHRDKDGKEIERGTVEEMVKKVPGLRIGPDGRVTMEGSVSSFKTDETSGQLTTEMVDPNNGKKVVNVSPDAAGVESTKYIGADGQIISQSAINHKDPENFYTDLDANGKVISTYNAVDNSYGASDNSFKFTNDGTELFGGQVHVNSSGDISYSDGTRLSNSSPGAVQASEAAATSASANASSVASALSAKAGNPATVSAGDLSACYGAYGSIVAAMNACLTSGNFAGFAQCLAAKGALESAIGVIAPKLVAMDDAAKSGLSGYALNEVGQKTGGSTNYRAIDEVISRQNGTSRTV